MMDKMIMTDLIARLYNNIFGSSWIQTQCVSTEPVE